jgi:hypothetical protein
MYFAPKREKFLTRYAWSGISQRSGISLDTGSGYFYRAQYKYIQNLQTSQGYIFFILQHLATNLSSFTHSKTLFLAVVLDFVLLALIKI